MAKTMAERDASRELYRATVSRLIAAGASKVQARIDAETEQIMARATARVQKRSSTLLAAAAQRQEQRAPHLLVLHFSANGNTRDIVIACLPSLKKTLRVGQDILVRNELRGTATDVSLFALNESSGVEHRIFAR